MVSASEARNDWMVLWLFMGFLLPGCSASKSVEFLYFNVSTNEIRVLDVEGITPRIAPGYLSPAPSDDIDSLYVVGLNLYGGVIIQQRFKLVWTEGGVSREAWVNREDLGLPSKLEQATVRLTYVGDEKWRITRLK